MNSPQVESSFIMPDGGHIRIRPAAEEDLPGMEWNGEFSHFRKIYKQHFQNTRNGSTRIWVAETEAGEIVGQVFIMLYSRQPEMADGINRAYLFSFRIKADYRGKGLGGFMLDFVEDFLISRGFKTLCLNVARLNVNARRMYENHGFKVVAPEEGRWRYEDQFGNWQTIHEPAWRMVKKLGKG